MRRTALTGFIPTLVLVASVALAAGSGSAAHTTTLGKASLRTAHVASEHYALAVRITKDGQPLTLHVHGQSAPHMISVRLKISDLTLPDGTKVRGPSGAALLDGPFLYQRAPSNLVLFGKIRWLRVAVSTLSPASDALRSVHDMTPAPLLHVLGEARVEARSLTVFRGTVAYDDPIVRTALHGITNGIEFRQLRITAWLGRDGLVHGVRLTGRTADGSMSLRLSARLYAFGRPVHITPPAPGTFLDKQLLQLAA